MALRGVLSCGLRHGSSPRWSPPEQAQERNDPPEDGRRGSTCSARPVSDPVPSGRTGWIEPLLAEQRNGTSHSRRHTSRTACRAGGGGRGHPLPASDHASAITDDTLPVRVADQPEQPMAMGKRARTNAGVWNGNSVVPQRIRTIRRRDKGHLRFVAAQPCLVCGRRPSDAHHLRFAEPRAIGRKVSDEFTVPLCRSHHRGLHDRGDEKVWWTEVQIDPGPIAERLWSATR
jgi:hypothetical protein